MLRDDIYIPVSSTRKKIKSTIAQIAVTAPVWTVT